MTFPTFSARTVAKARELRARGLVTADGTAAHVWWVESLRPDGDRYRVQEDVRRTDADTLSLTWVTCTCHHGMNIGAGQTHCYHVAAVLLGYLEGDVPVLPYGPVRARMTGQQFIDSFSTPPKES